MLDWGGMFALWVRCRPSQVFSDSLCGIEFEIRYMGVSSDVDGVP